MYVPKRDYRFEYVTEVMAHVEENQCVSCVFREEGEYPMCLPIAAKITLEEPVEEINDLGSSGLSCTKYRNGTPTPAQVEGQEELF